jgi:hypothetical protein
LGKDETIMQHAFLLALLKWAARMNRGKPIVLPTGRVDPAELVRVVTALKCAMIQPRPKGRWTEVDRGGPRWTGPPAGRPPPYNKEVDGGPRLGPDVVVDVVVIRL